MKSLFLALLLIPAVTYAYGPYSADLVRVIDGDTVEVRVHLWPGLDKTTRLRIDGVDTPETRTKNLCEKALGQKAKTFTREFAKPPITVIGIKDGKYAGRVLGDLLVNGESLRQALIDSGHARAYSGGKRLPWCE